MKPANRQWILLLAGLTIIAFWAYAYYFSPKLAYSGPSRRHITQTRAEAFLQGLEVFKSDFGNYPTGSNASVVGPLMGANPRRLDYLQVDGRLPFAINEKTQFVDAWGIAFQIEFPATNSPIVRSAGGNKIFGDEDDLVFSHSKPVKP